MAKAKAKEAEKAVQGSYDAHEYSYSVAWSADDRSFIGRVTEFPSLAAHGSSQEKALREIRTVVQHVVEDLAASGEEVPVPLGRREYSGRLNIRMAKELHRRLAAESAAQGVSLNTLINTKLAH
jgi:predicted HicB family RNase H-like nuclease